MGTPILSSGTCLNCWTLYIVGYIMWERKDVTGNVEFAMWERWCAIGNTEFHWGCPYLGPATPT